MRFSYAESMTDPSFYGPLACARGRGGRVPLDGHTGQHLLPAARHEHAYPYNPDGSREFLEDRPFLEPFSLIPALGAATSFSLRFTTFVVKVPIRNPVLLAKQATSTAVLTGGRSVPRRGHQPVARGLRRARGGVGSTAGAAWMSRSPSCAELAYGGYFEYQGKDFTVPAVKIAPVPAEPIPVLIGGHVDAACSAGPPAWATAGCTPGRPRGPAPAARSAHRVAPLRRGGTTLRSPRDLDGCLQRRRRPPPGGTGRDRRDRRLPLVSTRPARTRSRSVRSSITCAASPTPSSRKRDPVEGRCAASPDSYSQGLASRRLALAALLPPGWSVSSQFIKVPAEREPDCRPAGQQRVVLQRRRVQGAGRRSPSRPLTRSRASRARAARRPPCGNRSAACPT